MSTVLIDAEKLAIFTAIAEISAREVRNYVIEHWQSITEGLVDSSILFMAGIHGTCQGKYGEETDSFETMKVQVSSLISGQLCSDQIYVGPDRRSVNCTVE